jgi:hypothetical protein
MVERLRPEENQKFFARFFSKKRRLPRMPSLG